MFQFLKKTKRNKELDGIIAELEANLANNYKDAAQDALKQLEQSYQKLFDSNRLSDSQKKEYAARIANYKQAMRGFAHKDQKPRRLFER